MRPLLPFLSLATAAALAGCGGGGTQSLCDTTQALGAEMTVCGGSTTLKGADVSTYQGTLDWTKAKGQGVVFAFARVSDGTANPDNQFAANWKGMKAGGVVRGAYQYWRASVDPTAQANLVLSSLKNAGGMVAGDLPVVMDIETGDGASSSTIIAHMQTWLAAVEQGTGIKPIIYTSIGTYPVTTTQFSSYTLWVANYGVSCPSVPAGWSQWAFWQTAGGGGFGGGDADVFNGSLAQLTGLTLHSGADAGGSSSGGGDAGFGDAGGSGSSSGGSGSSSGSGSGGGSGGGSGSSSGGLTSSSGGGDAGSIMGAGSGGDSGAGSGSSSGGGACGH